jgi:ABC-type dipeptide/oligopeptide/nickel transport system permease subunit
MPPLGDPRAMRLAALAVIALVAAKVFLLDMAELGGLWRVLSFLGLGLPETIPEWGGDLQQALTALPTGIWWTALYPGLAMFVLVLGLSFLGEGLEAWLSGSGQASRAAQ